ncbi:hypothetical protein FIU92_01985 [Ruegeria sp. THAF33]|nr:hypothetical protein FIU92_01985 [Ruegeria sp. THAF33]
MPNVFNSYDKVVALAENIRAGSIVSQQDAWDIMRALQNFRDFERVVGLAESLLVQYPEDHTLTKAYAQALVELGNPIAAQGLLQQVLSGMSEADREFSDIKGVLGRAFKETCQSAARLGQIGLANDALTHSFAAYAEPYERDPKKNYYHGINQVALLHLAERCEADVLTSVNKKQLAREVLSTLDDTDTSDVWMRATRVEVCVALEDWDNALEAVKSYVEVNSNGDKTATAFQLHSTLRQLRDIWDIGAAGDTGLDILTTLEAAAFQRSSISDVGDGISIEKSAASMADTLDYTKENASHLEKMFGLDGLKTLRWFRQGVERASSVASVIGEDGSRVGTAFAICPKEWQLPQVEAGEIALMTNYHVMNENGYGDEALTLAEAKVRFEALSEKEFRAKRILFENQTFRNGLDATIFTVAGNLQKLKPVPCNLDSLPRLNKDKRVYVIGHPDGGELQFSLQDNRLLDHEGGPDGNPPEPSRVRVHYFAPTKPGSSGSPVFNEGWECIALHRAGSRYVAGKEPGMKQLNGKTGRYSANEGVWVGSIKARIPDNS